MWLEPIGATLWVRSISLMDEVGLKPGSVRGADAGIESDGATSACHLRHKPKYEQRLIVCRSFLFVLLTC